MPSQVYQGNWSKWADVVRSFNQAEKMPKRPHVFYAWYEYEDYSGSAIVVFYLGDQFTGSYFVETGSHCSCNGLEECDWLPTEYPTSAALIACLKREPSYRFPEGQLGPLIKRIEKFAAEQSRRTALH